MLPLAGILALGGCGKELTAGGLDEGEVSAVATDEPQTTSATASEAPSSGFSRGPDGSFSAASSTPQAQESAAVQGVIGLTAAVSLLSESGMVVPVTDGAAAVEVPIGGAGRVVLGRDRILEGDYPTVRITFTRVVADVQGLVIAGALFTGRVTVELGGAPLVVDFPAPVQVREETPSTVILRLQSQEWLALAQLTGSVPPGASVQAAAFRAAIEVDVE